MLPHAVHTPTHTHSYERERGGTGMHNNVLVFSVALTEVY